MHDSVSYQPHLAGHILHNSISMSSGYPAQQPLFPDIVVPLDHVIMTRQTRR